MTGMAISLSYAKCKGDNNHSVPPFLNRMSNSQFESHCVQDDPIHFCEYKLHFPIFRPTLLPFNWRRFLIGRLSIRAIQMQIQVFLRT